jgi:hypothetical protein
MIQYVVRLFTVTELLLWAALGTASFCIIAWRKRRKSPLLIGSIGVALFWLVLYWLFIFGFLREN